MPSFEQYTLARFIAQGSFEQHISRMKKRYRTQRDTVIAAIRSGPLAGRSTIYEEDAGLHFLMRLDTDLPDGVLEARAAEQGLRIACLSDYLYEPSPGYDHVLVVNYTGMDTEKLPEALERLADVLGSA